jgi:NAD(P)-dependent dehydrogenase (short-subunit alcohol dehydrogenase family)
MDITSTAAIVTGAASGLGAATAAELAQRGATVYGLERPPARNHYGSRSTAPESHQPNGSSARTDHTTSRCSAP